MSIIVIGAVFVDIKGYPSRTYIPGGRNAGKVRYVHGGVSRNIGTKQAGRSPGRCSPFLNGKQLQRSWPTGVCRRNPIPGN